MLATNPVEVSDTPALPNSSSLVPLSHPSTHPPNPAPHPSPNPDLSPSPSPAPYVPPQSPPSLIFTFPALPRPLARSLCSSRSLARTHKAPLIHKRAISSLARPGGYVRTVTVTGRLLVPARAGASGSWESAWQCPGRVAEAADDLDGRQTDSDSRCRSVPEPAARGLRVGKDGERAGDSKTTGRPDPRHPTRTRAPRDRAGGNKCMYRLQVAESARV